MKSKLATNSDFGTSHNLGSFSNLYTSSFTKPYKSSKYLKILIGANQQKQTYGVSASHRPTSTWKFYKAIQIIKVFENFDWSKPAKQTYGVISANHRPTSTWEVLRSIQIIKVFEKFDWSKPAKTNLWSNFGKSSTDLNLGSFTKPYKSSKYLKNFDWSKPAKTNLWSISASHRPTSTWEVLQSHTNHQSI